MIIQLEYIQYLQYKKGQLSSFIFRPSKHCLQQIKGIFISICTSSLSAPLSPLFFRQPWLLLPLRMYVAFSEVRTSSKWHVCICRYLTVSWTFMLVHSSWMSDLPRAATTTRFCTRVPLVCQGQIKIPVLTLNKLMLTGRRFRMRVPITTTWKSSSIIVLFLRLRGFFKLQKVLWISRDWISWPLSNPVFTPRTQRPILWSTGRSPLRLLRVEMQEKSVPAMHTTPIMRLLEEFGAQNTLSSIMDVSSRKNIPNFNLWNSLTYPLELTSTHSPRWYESCQCLLV